jgi:transcription initiation factor IIE alpha subunit
MKMTAAQIKRRLRGVVLNVVYQGHERQCARLDDVVLAAVLERLQYDVHVNLVREILQDLEERRFVSFCSEKNRMTGTVSIRRIQITPGGRDIIEKTSSDPGVEVD